MVSWKVIGQTLTLIDTTASQKQRKALFQMSTTQCPCLQLFVLFFFKKMLGRLFFTLTPTEED